MTEPQFDPNDAPDDDISDQPDSRMVTLRRDEIRAMEKDAKRTRQAEQRLQDVERELAFARSGHEFTEKQQKALLSVVDGDLTPEAIRTAAAELGFAPPQDGNPDDDMAALDRVSAASAGSSVPPTAPPDMNARLRAAAGRG